MSGLGNKEIMAQNLKLYMDLNNKSRHEVCADLGFSYSTFTDWVNANSYPRIDKIEMLANYFGIDKADLIEKQSDRQDVLSMDERSIVSEYRKLTNDDKEFLQNITSSVSSMEKESKKRLLNYYKMLSKMQHMDNELKAAHNDNINEEQIRLMNEDLENE